ncbi:endo-1,3(4)-beta-glucanase [Chlamydoabsidia padenii]|nr:endo-1,3(4)-beta-glucanase [Chlamydoabsidia padenii]
MGATNNSEPLTFLNPVHPPPFPIIQHPYPPHHTSGVVPTNSWLSNLFYTSTNNKAPTNSDPYTLRFLDDQGRGVSVVQKQEKTLGAYDAMNNVGRAQAGYLLNQPDVDLRLTNHEWISAQQDPTFQVSSWNHFGATIRLASSKNQSMEIPVARGMAYVTAHYQALTPRFESQHAMIRVESEQTIITNTSTIYHGQRFKIAMNDALSSIWIIYCLNGPLSLSFAADGALEASSPYTGTIRVTKLPRPLDESLLDQHRFAWTTGGTVEPEKNLYTIRWHVQGQGQPLLYAYPHHLETIVNVDKTPLRLESATKGTMYAVRGSVWIIPESQPDAHLTTWFPRHRSHPEPSTIHDILQTLSHDIHQTAQFDTNKQDNYFSGKGLQKYAMLALILNRPDQTGLRNPELARTVLDRLKSAFAVFLENRQKDPFLYDEVYKGIVARNGLPLSMGGTGDIHSGFGHSYYNDHHYHQGYFIVTAAVIHYLDPNWRSHDIRVWTDMLIRDVNAPNQDDPYFAPYRQWDWFAGHTWAGGIKINGAMEGRDQESVPESVNFYWGMKLWGLATDSPGLVTLANLQLDIMKRTTYAYFWMLNSNKNRHVGLVMNKVIGILFEQKLDYVSEE